MWAACAPLAQGHRGAPAGVFITPMAAVAGAVADAVLRCCQGPGIQRAWVNNGGDIALHLAPGAEARVGLVTELPDLADLADLGDPRDPRDPRDRVGRPQTGRWRTASVLPAPAMHLVVQAAQPVRGIATSGWGGRSFSFGIADAVTVLAATAAQADAAATLVANAVDLPHPGIQRRPASALKDDTDLGDRLVTVAVPSLTEAEARRALQAGLDRARALQATGLLHAAALVCQGCLATLPAAQTLQCEPTLVQ